MNRSTFTIAVVLTLSIALSGQLLAQQSIRNNAVTASGQSLQSVSSGNDPVYTEKGAEIIRAAMKDELQRNMARLKLENLNPPFFISYEVRDFKRTLISATLGAIIQSSSNHSRNFSPRVMVGSYERNDENFLDISSMAMSAFSMGSAMPLENDYQGIRRAIWLSTDGLYKSAADKYEKKLAAIKQQNLEAELAALPDFSKEKPQSIHIAPKAFRTDIPQWEKTARELSEVFVAYPQIQSSRVVVSLIEGMVYCVNSEGTDISYPIALVAFQSYANSQADDGEILNHQLALYAGSPDGMPPVSQLKSSVRNMADELITLRSAEKFDDTYTGPVMFEGQAAAELISQRLFMQSDGFIATREQISTTPGAAAFMGSNQSLGDRIGKRILPKDLSITASPSMKEYKGIPLIGSYEVDREGVVPPEKLVLVENGKLLTLLNDRIPSKEVQQSNGHDRLGTSQETGIAPGVIHVHSSQPVSAAEMKQELLDAAKTEGLKYAFIARQIASPTLAWEEDLNPEDFFTAQFGGGKKEGVLRQPILMYKVDVASGEETLVRSVEFGGVGVSSLRDIIAVEDQDFVYNTLTNPASSGNMGMIFRFAGSFAGGATGASGYPTSFIVPKSLIFEELEVKEISRTSTPKLPFVQSPLMEQ